MELSDYKRVIDSNKNRSRPIYGIRTFTNQLYATREAKVVANIFYDEMVMLDSITCEPLGY